MKARKKIVAGVALLLAASAGLVWWRSQPRPTAPLPAAPVPSNARGGPALPLWAGPDEATPLDSRPFLTEVTLESGIKARLFPVRPFRHAGEPIKAVLQLTGTDGKPLEGRGDLDAFVMDPLTGNMYRSAFLPRAGAGAGEYVMTFDLPAASDRPGKAQIGVYVSATGNVNDPGRIGVATTQVETGAPAMLYRPAYWTRADDGTVQVRVSVSALQPGPIALRGLLVDEHGKPLGDCKGKQQHGAGKDSGVLHCDVPATATAYGIVGLTLWYGAPPVMADYWAESLMLTSIDEVALKPATP